MQVKYANGVAYLVQLYFFLILVPERNLEQHIQFINKIMILIPYKHIFMKVKNLFN